jgi:small subunit ribosomal protein S16
MVRIRLRRVGAKKQPSYRIVVTDKRNPRDGRFIEKIGYYNPRTEPSTMEVDEGRALHWLSNGAQPSDAVDRIFAALGTKERYERLRAGESLETLLAEAHDAAAARPEIDPRTRRDEEVAQKTSKKAMAKAEVEALAAAEALEEEEAEAEAEVDDEVEEIEEVEETDEVEEEAESDDLVEETEDVEEAEEEVEEAEEEEEE